MFITVEGIEGCGKSTNAKFIVDYLTQAQLTVVHTREPGGTLVAEKIRNIFLDNTIAETITRDTELLLMYAARSQHITNVIKPALQANKYVVCERFNDATFAYQGGGRGVSIDDIKLLDNMVLKNFAPDLVLVLDLDVTMALDRVKNRGNLDRVEQEKAEFFTKVRQVYLDRAKSQPDKYKIIDASLDLASVQRQIQDILVASL
jgi:dTMP kinase